MAAAEGPANGRASAAPESERSDFSRELQELERKVEQLQGLKQRMQTDLCAQIMVEIMTVIVDDLCFDVCADVHRAHRMHMLPVHDPPGQPGNRVVNSPGYDIHGHIPEKVPKNEYFNCDHCHQKVGASRYTDHLSKCMLNRGRAARSRRDTAAQDSGGAGGPSTSPANPGRSLSSPSHFGNAHGNASPSLGAAASTTRIVAVSPVQPKQLQPSTSPQQPPHEQQHHQQPSAAFYSQQDAGLGKRPREQDVT